jgi:hypothetical protein
MQALASVQLFRFDLIYIRGGIEEALRSEEKALPCSLVE